MPDIDPENKAFVYRGSGPSYPRQAPFHSDSALVGFPDAPVGADVVSATLIGLDIDSIPTIRHAFETVHYPLTICTPDDIQTVSNHLPWNSPPRG